MVQWFAAVCALVLVTCLWRGLRALRSGSQCPVSLRWLGKAVPGCPKENSRSNRRPSVLGCDDACVAKADTVALICKPSALARHLVKNCPTFSHFTPISKWNWRASPHWQTFFGTCWPAGDHVHFVRDHLQMRDDGLVALDWAVAWHKLRGTTSNSKKPVLLIIPSSFGKITGNVLGLCEAGLQHGYLPVVFNRRGQNGTPLGTARLQEFGDPSDLREAVRYIRFRQPGCRLYAVSESTGSGLLLSYLGECGSSSYLTAAACISPILRCQAWYESALHWLYQSALLLYQKSYLSRYRTALGQVLSADALFSSSSLQDLEKSLHCGAGGGWEGYWERNEPLRDVDEVAVPILCLCSQDDPVRGHSDGTLPLELFWSNPHLFLLLAVRGGHCGFATPTGIWSHSALLEFFHSATDFCCREEHTLGPLRRRGTATGAGSRVGPGAGIRTYRHRSVSSCRKPPPCPPTVRPIANWQRSYTR